MTVIILQSVPSWLTLLKQNISEKFPELEKNVFYSNSFDFGIDLIPKEGPVVVFTSNMFHDSLSEHYEHVTEKIKDKEKNANTFGKLAKAINPKVKVFLLSEFDSKEQEYLDGFIKKNNEKHQVTISSTLRILQEQYNVT